jgi:uncharacterized protein
MASTIGYSIIQCQKKVSFIRLDSAILTEHGSLNPALCGLLNTFQRELLGLILEVVGPKIPLEIIGYNTMKIEIHHIPTNGLDLKFIKPVREFPGLAALSESGECEFVDPLTIHLEMLPLKDFVRVKGRLETKVRQACGRCLETFETPLKSHFTLNYSRLIPQDVHKAGAEGIELTADQIGMVYFEGEEIDFTDAIQEQTILAIPFNPICKPECKGLCPRCGGDLNAGPCHCGEPTPDSSFSVLKDLKLQLKK